MNYRNNRGKYKVFLIHNNFTNDNIDIKIEKCKEESL